MCFTGPGADENTAGSGLVTQDEAPSPERVSLRPGTTTSFLLFLLLVITGCRVCSEFCRRSSPAQTLKETF